MTWTPNCFENATKWNGSCVQAKNWKDIVQWGCGDPADDWPDFIPYRKMRTQLPMMEGLMNLAAMMKVSTQNYENTGWAHKCLHARHKMPPVVLFGVLVTLCFICWYNNAAGVSL